MNTHYPSRGVACAFALLAASAASVIGQTAPARNATAVPPVTLEQFTVSSNKVESYQADSVQMGIFRDVDPVDVPLTVNELTREVLDDQAARGLFDALKNTAGATRSQLTGAAYDNLAIRGILIENRGNYRLNGSLPIINLADIALENKQRVEVLKGTSALYYGFVPPSGIINLVTKRPLPAPLTDVTVNANSAGGVGAAVDVSRRFGPAGAAGLRINLADGAEEIGLDNYGGHRNFESAAFDYKVTPKLMLRADFEHLDKNVTEQSAITLPTAVAGVVTPPPLPPNSRNLGGEWQRYDARMTNWWTRVDYLITPQWTIFAEAGNARTHRNRIYGPFTFANPQATSVGTTGNGNLNISFFPGQDYRNSNYRFETFGRFLLGEVRNDVSIGVTGNTRRSDAPSQGSVTFAQNYYHPVPVPEFRPTTTTLTHVPTRILDYGYYASDRVSAFNERVQLIAGGRFTDYVSTTSTTNYDVTGKFSPLLSAVVKPTTNTSLYASYIKGLEAGGNAPNGTKNQGSVLPPLTSTQKEVGAKAKLFSGLLAQVGVYQIDRPSTFIDPATNYFVANGLARFRGVEAFVSGELTSTVSLVASAQDLDARQVKALNATTLNKTPEGTPRYTGSLFAEWRTPMKNLNVSAGTYYVGRRPVNNTDQGYIGGYTTYSAGLSYHFKLGNVGYMFRANCDNLTNKNAWAASGANLLGVTAPRLAKFSVTASF